MNKLKKLLSVLLIASMIGSLGITALAAEEDAVLAVYKADGSILASSDSVAVGDQITVKMTVNTSVSAFAAGFRIWYDKASFAFNKEQSSYTDTVKNAFTGQKLITDPAQVTDPTDEEQAMLDAGYYPANLTVESSGIEDITTPTGEWVSLVFTATKEVSAAPFQIQVRSFDSGDVNVAEGWTTGSASVSVVEPTIAVTSVTLAPTSLTLRAGQSSSLTATVIPDNATNPGLTWSSSDETIATVDETGKVTAVAAGTATIKAAADGKEGSCQVTVLENAEGAYTVTMPEKLDAEVGSDVEIPVTIGTNGEETAFNAVDVSFSYDPEALTLVSDEITGFTVKSEGGNIRVYCYGENKNLGELLKLQFTVAKAGETVVNCTDAYVDKSVNATEKNVASATILNGQTTINATQHFTVTLPEGMSSEMGTTVEAGSEYIFKITEMSSYYDYTVTATMGGKSAEIVDNGNGTYSIKNVTGDVVIQMTKTGKEVKVTLSGDDITGNSTAAYGTDYNFKVARQSGYNYEITVTVAGSQYTGYTGPDADGNYTIPGSDLIGEVVITVNKTSDIPEGYIAVRFEGTGAGDVVNPSTAIPTDVNFSFSINKEAGYMYTVTYSIDGAAASKLPEINGAWTVPKSRLARVQNILTIQIEKTKAYSVTFVRTGPGSNYTYMGAVKNGNAQVAVGADYSFQVTQHTVMDFEVTAKIGSKEMTLTTTSTLNPDKLSNTAVYTIPAADITDDIVITIAWKVNTDKINLVVEPMVNTNGGTIYFIGVQQKTDVSPAITCDQLGDTPLLRGLKYTDMFKERFGSEKQVDTLLVYVEKGETLTEEDVVAQLHYIGGAATHEVVQKNLDVNLSGMTDINDAQLVYDIYNGKYAGFDVVSMIKFYNADVNCNAVINVEDAAAVVSEL